MNEKIKSVKAEKSPTSEKNTRAEQPETFEASQAIDITDSNILQAVYSGADTVEREYEVERRYTPNRLLSEQELAQYESLNIEQMYIRVRVAEDEQHSFRLRRTWKKEDEPKTLRVAHKRKESGAAGRNEYQQRFVEDDPDMADARADFENLWRHPRWEAFAKMRWYIPWKLPNGHTCAIHYDVHRGGKLDGFTRIEIEFESDEDAAFVENYSGKEPVLPGWIGADVTHNKEFGSKSLAEHGPPKRD